MKYLMCNLKSNKTLKEMLEFKKDLDNLAYWENFILFPSFLYLSLFYDSHFKIGSQNVSKYSSGSHTGEVLASQLKSMKVDYTLINHAEVNEKFKNVIHKIKNATKEKIKVVLCFGEKSKKEEVLNLLINDIKNIFSNITYCERKNIILAYEPFYAINKGKIISPRKLHLIISSIKEYIKNNYHFDIEIVYGGSIKPDNINELINIKILDGFLIGNSANNIENIKEFMENF